MFGTLGMTELLVIGGVAMLVFGPSQVPRLGRALGQTIKEFRCVGRELTQTIEDESKEDR
jgi:sec-independent protein translocase protein TatA